MKKYLLLLLVCTTAMGAFAQNETRRALSEREGLTARSGSTGISALRSGTPTHRLDSTILVMGEQKVAFEFDADGNLTVETTFGQLDNEWKSTSKKEFEHDSYGNVTMLTFYIWDDGNNVWAGNQRQIFEFDANGNQILDVTFMMLNDAWTAISRNVSAFDADGNQTMAATYFYDSDNNVWIGFFKWEHTFDNHGNTILELFFAWNDANNDWEEDFRREIRNEYTTDSGRIVKFYSYEMIGGSEVRVLRVYFDYDAAGNMIEKVSYRWQACWQNEGEGIWVGAERFKREYDSAGNRTLEITQVYWGGWVNAQRTQTTFNNDGRITIFYMWENNQWEELSRTIYDEKGNTLIHSSISRTPWGDFGEKFRFEYDLTVLLTNVLFPASLSDERTMYNKPTAMTQYFWAGDAWFEADVTNFYYTNLEPTSVPEKPSAVSISVFPNPVSDSFVISGIEENTVVTIFDLNGRTVLQQIVSPNESISVSCLPQGMFLVRASGNVVTIIRQ